MRNIGAILSITGLALLVYYGAAIAGPKIQKKVEGKARSAVAQIDDGVTVKLDALDAIVSGTVASEDVRDNLVRALKRVEGVRKVVDRLEVSDPGRLTAKPPAEAAEVADDPPVEVKAEADAPETIKAEGEDDKAEASGPFIDVHWDGSTLKVSGLMKRSGLDRVNERLLEDFAADSVEGSLTLLEAEPDPATDPTFERGAMGLLAALSFSVSGHVELREGLAVVNLVVGDEGSKARLLQLAQVSVAPGVETRFTAMLKTELDAALAAAEAAEPTDDAPEEPAAGPADDEGEPLDLDLEEVEIVEEPAAEEPAVEEPAAEEPAAEEPVKEEPPAKAEEPVKEEPPAKAEEPAKVERPGLTVATDPGGALTPQQCAEIIADLIDKPDDRITFLRATSSRLDDHGRAQVKRIAGYLKRCPEATGEVRGFHHNHGDPDQIRLLTRKRAYSVHATLIEEGIDKQRFTYNGLGYLFPKYPNSIDKRALNERVEISIGAD